MDYRRYIDRLTSRPSMVTMLFVVAGLWLVVSPYLLGFSWHEAALGNATVVGVAVVVLAVVRHASRPRFEKLRWTLLVLGGWMIASPFVATYFQIEAALWSALVSGAVILTGAIVATATPVTREATT